MQGHAVKSSDVTFRIDGACIWVFSKAALQARLVKVYGLQAHVAKKSLAEGPVGNKRNVIHVPCIKPIHKRNEGLRRRATRIDK